MAQVGIGHSVAIYGAGPDGLLAVMSAKPGDIVSHYISLDEAPEMYERFDKRKVGVAKVVVNPNK